MCFFPHSETLNSKLNSVALLKGGFFFSLTPSVFEACAWILVQHFVGSSEWPEIVLGVIKERSEEKRRGAGRLGEGGGGFACMRLRRVAWSKENKGRVICPRLLLARHPSCFAQQPPQLHS